MAVLALGALGAGIGSAIGGTFLGMSAASLGWSLGSMAGNMLFGPKQPDQFGPRLGDLKVQSSTYGNPIPIVYGAMRVAGTVIWSTDIAETPHSTTQSGGGKGGGGGSVTQTSYTYSQSFAVAVCEGTIAGVRKIWANGKLIYNLSDTADIATMVASNNNARGMRFYLGSETQTADSLMQAYVGAADTPAYRGTAYVVFENMQLADYGNRMPNLEFEVVKSASEVIGASISTPSILGTDNIRLWPDANFSARGYSFSTGVSLRINDTLVQSTTPFVNPSNPFILINGERWYFSTGYSSAGSVSIYDAQGNFKRTITGFLIYNGDSPCLYFEFNGSVYVVNPARGGWFPYTTLLRLPTYIINIATGAITSANYGPDLYWYNSAYKNGILYFSYAGYLARYDLINSVSLSNLTLPFGDAPIAFALENGNALIAVLATTTTLYRFYLGNALLPTSPQLASIVSDICTRAGLTAGQIDVTALTDTVDGYTVQRGTARSQIEQLMQAFYFDAVESDGKIKFVKRGGAAAINIPEDDLAAHSYGSAMPDNLVTTRKQEMELPIEFNVQYMDKSANYLVNSQRSKRLTTSSQNKISVNLAIAMTATKAKQISDVLMYDAWTGRTTFNFTTGWKYSYLEPTDVITVTKGISTYTVRVISDDLNVGISGRTAVLEDNTVYTQTATAVEAPIPINTVSTVPLTDMLLLDIPLLRDQDDAVGFYAAACGYSAGWKGAQGFKSNDGGATWNSYGNAFLNAASIGTAAGVLGAFSSGNIFDETNTVSVVLISGTLSSDTELNILNGANVALVGNEIIQFKNATLTATSTYTLSGLLRGRQGTEWAMTTHAIGDRFVLLSSTSTYLFPASSAEYNLSRKYRGVSMGGFLADAANIDFTNTAVAQKPLSPVQIGGGRNAALDITLNWTRRTRIGGGWGDFADVPLGEASESYSIDIMQGATVKRTLTSVTPTVQYTSAQQVADFGGNQASLLVNVYQISATIGRGFAGIRTV